MDQNVRLFVEDALELYMNGHYLTSLALVCCAIDSTAKTLYDEQSNATRIKKWINEHINIISSKGLPAIFGRGCKFKFGNIPQLKKDINGCSGLEDVIYYLIRCSLVHECKINDHLILSDKEMIFYDDNVIFIPHKIIIGLIEAIESI